MDALTIAAASGIRSRMESLDLLANNLANTATSGYKRDQEFYGVYSANDADDPSGTLPVIQRGWTDFSQGTITPTGSPTDLALSGKGFFVVNGPSGPLYTRNGNLKILPTGELATAEGYALQNTNGQTITVEPNKAIEISTDGAVHQGNQVVAQLKVVEFPKTISLEKAGATCFRNLDPKSPPLAATATQVMQGKLEGSNVPVAEAAMRLVGVMRQFEMLQKAIGISSDMDMKSIQEVARVNQ
jgi:flagellar basal-body rod protein FlgF